MREPERQVVHESVGSGRWFPGGRHQLESMVAGFISSAGACDIDGKIVAAIAPHAGYAFSGRVAGHTFRALKDNAGRNAVPDVVVVLGFAHSMSFSGVALMDGDVLETPLGAVELDHESGGFLAKQCRNVYYSYGPHDGEHSAENEIPFIQAALPGVKTVIGLMGDHDVDTLSELVSALVELARSKHVVVVASTDLLHSGDYDLVSRTDLETLKRIEVLDYSGLMADWGYDHQVCCGIMPVMAVMQFAEAMGAVGKVLSYRNSGDDNPESRGDWVVGYGSVVFSV